MQHNQPRIPLRIEDNYEFNAKVEKAIEVVKTILDNTKNPALASPEHTHTYDDKFTLSEFITNTGLTATLNVLDKMGLGSTRSIQRNESPLSPGSPRPVAVTTESTSASAEALRGLSSIVHDEKKSVTMRFMARETCLFLKEEEILVEDPRQFVKNETKTVGDETTVTNVSYAVKTKVKQFHWKIGIEYGIYIYCGSETSYDAVNSQPIITKNVLSEVITRTTDAPYAPTVDTEPVDLSLTWLLQKLNKETLQSEFSIDREKESCRTPRNNDDVGQAWNFFRSMGAWCHEVSNYFVNKDTEIYHSDRLYNSKYDKKYLSSITSNNIFVPVLPIFESLKDSNSSSDSSATTSPIPSSESVNQLLAKQYITMSESINTVSSHFSPEPFLSSAEATIVLLTKHMLNIAQLWSEGVNHIEDMLCSQLYSAIGKHVSDVDLDEFIYSHNQKLFADTYAPEPFCYTIRRPDQYPDGMISIEETTVRTFYFGNNGRANKNAKTFTRQLETTNSSNPMFIPINSATNIKFDGNLFLHAWMLQRFQKKPTFQLAARARQFSSFLLLIGKLSGPDSFEPEHGIILQNKDEVLIPLLMDEMPSAKAFKDAIGSLSPEQQRFAKAFRDMKLSSCVFGVCIVQLKPQLEVLLGLPDKSLTKEIRLTQDLLSLFIDYQIPSDLLSYDGPNDLEPSAKVEVVKGHVKNVQDMIDELKQKELKEAQIRTDMALEEKLCERGTILPPTPAPSGGLFGASPPVSTGGLFGAPAPAPASAPVLFGAPAPAPAPTGVLFGSPAASPACFSAASTAIPAPLPEATVMRLRGKSDKPVKNTDVKNVDSKGIEVFSGNISEITSIPKLLDANFEMFGADEKYGGALRSTIISCDESWEKKSKQNILSKLRSSFLSHDEKKSERNKAIDLLDALSRSGVLPMSHSELHVIIASTHCFDKSVVNTVVQDNVNPIEKIERSNLLVASVIHNIEISSLVSESVDELERIANLFTTVSIKA